MRAGSPIPADGCVVEGASRVDEALLTGESRPVVKSGGDALIGGAVNVTSPLMMRIEHVGQQTVLSAIVRLLDRAMTEKPRITQLADRVAHHFIGAAGWRRDRCGDLDLDRTKQRSGSLFRCSWLPVHARCRWRHRLRSRPRPATLRDAGC